ncbi:FadR family transcriptional regulator, partial [Streptomyces sp. SID6648]|nr:FadR family transcriptional regulator [Streptomyces sp. SID6648]
MAAYSTRGVHGQVVQSLGARIVGGAVAEGTTLDVRALGEELDVSLTVMRESLKVLAGKGLVDARQKRGTFV